MRFAVNAVFGDSRLVARGEYEETPPAGGNRWRVAEGYIVAADPRYSVLLDGLSADSLDGIREQATDRLSRIRQGVTQ